HSARSPARVVPGRALRRALDGWRSVGCRRRVTGRRLKPLRPTARKAVELLQLGRCPKVPALDLRTPACQGLRTIEADLLVMDAHAFDSGVQRRLVLPNGEGGNVETRGAASSFQDRMPDEPRQGLDEADVSAHDRFKLVASLLGHAEVIDMKTPVGPTAAEQRRQHPDLLQQSKSVCLERSTNDLAVPELEEGHSSVFDGLFARGKT